MTLHRERLADITTLGSTAAAICTNASGQKTFVKGYELHNTNTTAETVKLFKVPDSAGTVGTAADGNRFLNIALAPNETLIYVPPGYGHILSDANDTIQGQSTTASKVTVSLFGDRDY
jgi:hypothetical protein